MDLEQLAALRVLRYWLGNVEILGVVHKPPEPPPAPVQGVLQLEDQEVTPVLVNPTL